MAPFDTTPHAPDEIVGHVASAIAAVAADPKLAGHLLAPDLVVRLEMVGDGEHVVAHVRLGPDTACVRTEDLEERADVVLRGPAEVVHRMWTGALDPGAALGRRLLEASGPVDAVLRALVALPPTFPAYRRALRIAAADAETAAVAS